MKTSLISRVERIFYAPTFSDRLISLLLLPLSWLYCVGMFARYKSKTPRDVGLPVVSIGNLTVGGSGKTPLVTALSAGFQRPAVVLRGYGRKSEGMIVVSDGEEILCDVLTSGDEAMIYAQKLHGAVVIVSEVREHAIEKAKAMGCSVVFLDDGYSKHQIKKLDLLIEVQTPNTACLPAGPFRERLWPGKDALSVREERDFTRRTELKDATEKMVLVTAIARPERLDAYLPEVAGKYYFPDHHYFTFSELETILRESGASSLLVTYKDYVKIAHFELPVSLLDMELEIAPSLMENIKAYVNTYYEESRV